VLPEDDLSKKTRPAVARKQALAKNRLRRAPDAAEQDVPR
jgi:hypothetical protein